eukprot:snap_masked-scaffold_9-processed-gene-7.36-mRNA-1 protein AED:1.00 eAED:1.00 QI:0/0/0/0/1/1/2/0/153
MRHSVCEESNTKENTQLPKLESDLYCEEDRRNIPVAADIAEDEEEIVFSCRAGDISIYFSFPGILFLKTNSPQAVMVGKFGRCHCVNKLGFAAMWTLMKLYHTLRIFYHCHFDVVLPLLLVLHRNYKEGENLYSPNSYSSTRLNQLNNQVMRH